MIHTVLLLALAAPVPFPRPARPMTWAETLKFLEADKPIVMNWNGVDYPVTFTPTPDYHAATTHSGRFLWHGDWWMAHDGAGQVSIYVREWHSHDSNRDESPLSFRFPATLHRDGRIGGPMPSGGKCWLRRVK